MLTGTQRLLEVVAGRLPDRVPFAPNIGQWFSARQAAGQLPRELADCPDEVEAMKRLGADIFSRRCGHFVRTAQLGGVHVETRKAGTHRSLQTVSTPRGVLSRSVEFQPESFTSFEREHLWKDLDAEYPAVRALLEQTDFHFDEAAWRKAHAQVGAHGLAIVGAQQTPLKRLIELAGPENALVWLHEAPEPLRELCEIHTEKALAFAREVAASEAFGMMSMDNLDSQFYSPSYFRRFCRDYYRRIGEVLHARGKFWCAHACGRVSLLRDQVADVQLDGLEGTPHAPLGDIDLAQFRDTISYPRHVVWGGMTCHEQEIRKEAKARIRDFVRRLFETLRPFRRFVFSSACNTSIRTPYENLLYFRDACWEFGRA